MFCWCCGAHIQGKSRPFSTTSSQSNDNTRDAFVSIICFKGVLSQPGPISCLSSCWTYMLPPLFSSSSFSSVSRRHKLHGALWLAEARRCQQRTNQRGPRWDFSIYFWGRRRFVCVFLTGAEQRAAKNHETACTRWVTAASTRLSNVIFVNLFVFGAFECVFASVS